ADGALDDPGLQRHDGVSPRLLVAGVGEGIERQRVLIRRDDGLFHQASDDARFVGAELERHGNSFGYRRCEAPATYHRSRLRRVLTLDGQAVADGPQGPPPPAWAARGPRRASGLCTPERLRQRSSGKFWRSFAPFSCSPNGAVLAWTTDPARAEIRSGGGQMPARSTSLLAVAMLL